MKCVCNTVRNSISLERMAKESVVASHSVSFPQACTEFRLRTDSLSERVQILNLCQSSLDNAVQTLNWTLTGHQKF